jgi:putative membrane protein
MTHHGDADLPIGLELLGVALAVAAWAYVVAARRTTWPRARTVRWLLGVAAALAGVVLAAIGSDVRAHVAAHLLIGMTAPLLLVTAAPVTLALRTLPWRHARAVARLLASRPAALVTHPVVAAVLDVGGLWLLYRTTLLAAVPPAFLHLHMLLAGYLFAFALVGADPAPHRPGLGLRAGVLVAVVAAHDVLAKLVYAGGEEAAGLLMHYGATPVHVALFVLLGREWAAGRRRVAARAGIAGGPRGTSPA